MSKAKKSAKTTVYLTLLGSLDDGYMPEMDVQFNQVLAQPFDEVDLNLSNVTFFSDAALDKLRIFCEAIIKKGGVLKLDNSNEYVAELLTEVPLSQ